MTHQESSDLDKELFNRAIQSHRGGDIAQAERLYRDLLGRQPNHPDAIHMLGVIALQIGRTEDAGNLIRQAIALNPSCAEAYSNLASLHAKQGDLDAAVGAYQKCIALEPVNKAQAYYNLGNVLRQQQRFDDAAAAYRQAIVLKPKLSEAHHNLGVTLEAQGRYSEAVVAYKQALDLKPYHAEAYFNLGNALQSDGKLDEAVAAYEYALALNPTHAMTHLNLGNARWKKQQHDKAISAYRQAIAIQPDFAEAHGNLGRLLTDLSRLDEAIASLRCAVAAKPDFAQAYSDLGIALREVGKVQDAIAACLKAISLKPDFAAAYNGLGLALDRSGELDRAVEMYRKAIALDNTFAEAFNNLGSALKDAGQLDEAIDVYRTSISLKPTLLTTASNLLLALHYHPAWDAAAILAEHLRWNREHAQSVKKLASRNRADSQRGRRLRIGYVSADFRSHSVGRFMLPLVRNHDTQQFEIYCYSNVSAPDSMTSKLRSHAQVWRDTCGQSDEQLAALIRDDEIDILVDLSMHTGGNRLMVFARKPAPVQVSYLAYCSTTGLDAIDYRLTDPYFDPAELGGGHYSERSIYLPETYWCYEPSEEVSEVSAVPAQISGRLAFGSLQNFCKVSHEALVTWASILHEIPNSRLLLHAKRGSHRARVLETFERRGIVRDRVQFVDYLPMADYFRLYHQVDVVLDTFPFAGGTTTCDALWMGVPVVTLAGRTAVGRAGTSILSNVGLTDLIARSTDQYVQLASDLAKDLGRLAELRSTLRKRMQSSPLMDAKRFAGHVEHAYQAMWRERGAV